MRAASFVSILGMPLVLVVKIYPKTGKLPLGLAMEGLLDLGAVGMGILLDILLFKGQMMDPLIWKNFNI